MHKLAYRIDEAVELSGLGRTALYSAIGRGELPARKHGRRTVVLARDLRVYLEALPTKAAPSVDRTPDNTK